MSHFWRRKDQTKSLIFFSCALLTVCNPSVCRSLSCNSSTGRLLAMIQVRLVTNINLLSSWLDLQMKQLHAKNKSAPCASFEWQADWCRDGRKGMWDLLGSFYGEQQHLQSLGEQWSGKTSSRSESMSSFFLLPVLVGSHKHIYPGWWNNEIKQRCQLERLLPLPPVRAGLAQGFLPIWDFSDTSYSPPWFSSWNALPQGNTEAGATHHGITH